MKRVVLAGIFIAAGAAVVWAGGPEYRLVESKTEGGSSARRLQKLIVLGISGDREIRNRFEDKLVTHFRGKGFEAIASHTLVPDLATPVSRDRLLEALAREKVDGAMTVRAVPVEKDGEEPWAAAWRAWADSPSTVADLVLKSIPAPVKKAKRYGIEFALWDLSTTRPVWAARTSVHTRGELSSGVGDLLQLAIGALEETPWLRSSAIDPEATEAGGSPSALLAGLGAASSRCGACQRPSRRGGAS
jgi:hypothetical protein